MTQQRPADRRTDVRADRRAAEPDGRDALTGLNGADSARAKLVQWAGQAEQASEQPTVHALLLGFRRFDAINLAYGSATGDAALAEVATRMTHFASAELDGAWHAVRSGGKFLLLANEACSRERWQLFAEQLANHAARPIPAGSVKLRLSPRIALLRGLAGEGAESLLDRLGQTLAVAERQPGRRLMWADGEAIRAGRTSAQLEEDLLAAIDGDQIEVVYQPQFAAADNRLTGAEALARWNHPRLGRIGAGTLFTIAERADHVVPLSRHIARLALAGARRWRGGLRLSLNVTPADLAAAAYADELIAMVRGSGFPASRLTLEVTEQALLGDMKLAQDGLGRLTEAGMRVALDDFGAGFCNFRYLKLLPLHYLKLDRSMVDGIVTDRRDLDVLRGIIAMARALGLEVIAEGIESEAQRQIVADEGCSFYQGFVRAQPMSKAEFRGYANRG